MTQFKMMMTTVMGDIDHHPDFRFGYCRIACKGRRMSSSRYAKIVWRGIKYGLLDISDATYDGDRKITITEKGRKYMEVKT